MSNRNNELTRETEIIELITGAYKKRGVGFVEGTVERAATDTVESGAEGSIEKGDENYKVSFSSTTPDIRPLAGYRVEEVLSHKSGAMDTTRLNNGGCVLWDHDQKQPIGVVTKNSVEVKDDKGYCNIRFGKSAKAVEVKANVDDNILSKISVGYQITQIGKPELIRNKAGKIEGARVIATKWEPREVSIVAVPADISAEFVRSAADAFCQVEINNTTQDKKDMSDNTKEVAALEGARIEEDKQLQERSVNSERERVSQIEDVLKVAAGTLNENDKYALRSDAIKSGKSPVDFHKDVINKLAAVSKEAPETLNPVDKLDLSKKDAKNYSFCRAVGLAAGILSEEDAKHEAECSAEVHKNRSKAGSVGTRSAKGGQSFAFPSDMMFAERQRTTTQTPTYAGAGDGGLTGQNNRPENFIENLRDMSIMIKMGITVLAGLTSNIRIPRKTNSATFSWKAEATDTGNTDLTFDSVDLNLHTASGAVGFSRELILNGNPSIEAIVMRDLARGAALVIDSGIIAGSGASNQPSGMGAQGLPTGHTVTAAVPSWASVVNLMTTVENANALEGNLAYLCTPTIKSLLMTTPKTAGDARFLMENGMMAGYPVYSKTSDLGEFLWFGNWSEIIAGFWNMLDLQRDTAAGSVSGSVFVRGFVDMDVGFRHLASFAKQDSVV